MVSFLLVLQQILFIQPLLSLRFAADPVGSESDKVARRWPERYPPMETVLDGIRDVFGEPRWYLDRVEGHNAGRFAYPPQDPEFAAYMALTEEDYDSEEGDDDSE